MFLCIRICQNVFFWQSGKFVLWEKANCLIPITGIYSGKLYNLDLREEEKAFTFLRSVFLCLSSILEADSWLEREKRKWCGYFSQRSVWYVHIFNLELVTFPTCSDTTTGSKGTYWTTDVQNGARTQDGSVLINWCSVFNRYQHCCFHTLVHSVFWRWATVTD